MSEWRECELAQLTNKIGSGATPRGGSNSYKDEGISLIRSQNVLDLQFSTNGLAFIDEGQADALKNVIVESNDILLNITGDSVARVCRVPDDILPARVNQHVAIIRANDEKLIPRFLLYYLMAQKEELLSQSEIGATRRAITKGVIEKFIISLPPLPEQKAIAEVLSSLDDKIDLLHRQNKTLEQMAQTLFRQWFVEEAQEDWEGYKVYDIADHIKESIKPASNPLQTYKHYSLPAFDNGLNPIIEAGREILSNKYKVIPKSILVSKLNPIVPRIWAISSDVSENAICSTEFQVFKPKKESYYEFLCFLFKSDDAVGELEMAASGTSGSHQRVKPQDILNIPFVTPSFCKIEDYSLEVLPLIEKQQRNNKYIHTLQSLRDTLLPKLMSGEVRVSLL
ncbi:MAG TPA: restriction endonuclease subunit S [Crenotrichaceae bacterium]|nr:restriction endonuclease subunit S [Crenotrichaceae bacterium]